MAKKATKTEATAEIDVSKLKKMKKIHYLETRDVGMDLVLSNGKGIPIGSNIMLYGPPGTGKTTIIASCLKRILDKYKAKGIPCRVHYVDSESSRNLLESTGLEEYIYDPEEYAPQQVIYHEYVNAFKQLEAIYTRMLDENDNWGKHVMLVVIDSVTKLSAESMLEIKHAVDKPDFGDNARTRKKLYGKWLSCIQKADITQFWVSQVAVVQGATQYQESKKPAVSEFDRHNMDIIIKLSKTTNTNTTDVRKETIKTIQGDKSALLQYIVTMDAGSGSYVKSREGQNFSVDVLLRRGVGTSNPYMLRNLLAGHGFISKEGRAWSLGDSFISAIGVDAIQAEGITDTDDVPVLLLNKLCRTNEDVIIEFLKTNECYRLDLKGNETEDDGLF